MPQKTEVKPRTGASESTQFLQASINSKSKHEMRTGFAHIALNASDEHNYVPQKSVYLRWVKFANTMDCDFWPQKKEVKPRTVGSESTEILQASMN